MSPPSRYWTFISIHPAGGYRAEIRPECQFFFQDCFPDDRTLEEVPDGRVQKELIELSQSPKVPARERHLAAFCLRCFISDQILQVCTQLAAQFGSHHGFTCADLLPYVLNDDLRLRSHFVSVGQEILHSFEPHRSNLSTWTARKVKQNRELNGFLLEQGVYLISDWAILNDTRSRSLERLLREVHLQSEPSIQQTLQLLASYHAIYRHDRLRDNQAGKTCQPPTPEQLCQIADRLPESITPQAVLKRLQDLADLLRQHRIDRRGGAPKLASLDDQEAQQQIANLPTPELGEAEQEQAAFLTDFQKQFTKCLEQAIVQVMQHWIDRQSPQSAHQFTFALCLMHCKGLAMGAIAPLIQLKAQYQVSRLLKLKQLRADIQRCMISHLQPFVLHQAAFYTDAERLHQLHQGIGTVLEELVEDVMQEAALEGNLVRGHPLKSRFARSLCQYLHQTDRC
ncbi:MAG: hypothetical protein SFW36_15285 [Leptolyngbyaceae cyanobacterium bins.59]|nr:hypothetical protein [Leptolyngbyaceae cyanobacterium bins.59]